MIYIKDKKSVQMMAQAGALLSEVFLHVGQKVTAGVSTLEIDSFIDQLLHERSLKSCTKGYMGYKHVSCIAVNDEVVHGVPRLSCVLRDGDFVKIDICASFKGYCADMARGFFVGAPRESAKRLAVVAQQALDKGIEMARVGNRLSDISAAIQAEVERHGFGVVRDFAGHGIGRQMHEEPEILNYGKPGKGVVLKEGMTFAIEPMITFGDYRTYIGSDGWTVKTVDGSLAAHVEDTVAITNSDPLILTRGVFEQQNNMSVS